MNGESEAATTAILNSARSVVCNSPRNLLNSKDLLVVDVTTLHTGLFVSMPLFMIVNWPTILWEQVPHLKYHVNVLLSSFLHKIIPKAYWCCWYESKAATTAILNSARSVVCNIHGVAAGQVLRGESEVLEVVDDIPLPTHTPITNGRFCLARDGEW